MKKLLIGALLCAMIGIVAGCGGGSDNNTTPSNTNTGGKTVLFTLDDSDQVTKSFVNDNGDPNTKFAYNDTIKFSGAGSIMVTPSGNNETKLKFDLPVSQNAKWLNSSVLGLQLYIPTGMSPAPTHIFYGIEDMTDKVWIDGTFYAINGSSGWIQCEMDIVDTMKNKDGKSLNLNHQYRITLSFFNETLNDAGVKTKAPLDESFNFDEIYLK